MQSSHEEWVRCFYSAWNRRDWESIGAMLTTDVEWFSASRGEFVRGVDAVLALFQSTVEGYPAVQIEVRAVHNLADVLVCECGFRSPRVEPPSRRRGPTMPPATFCDLFRIRDGRCSAGRTYSDSLRMIMAMTEGEECAA